MLRSYLLIIPLTLLWPIIHLMVFLFRFGKLPPSALTESTVFVGMGFVSGVVLIFLMQKAKSRRWKMGTFVGYLIAIRVFGLARQRAPLPAARRNPDFWCSSTGDW